MTVLKSDSIEAIEKASYIKMKLGKSPQIKGNSKKNWENVIFLIYKKLVFFQQIFIRI